MNPTVCLITPGHLSSTPRLVREANALHTAGYPVHVVCGRHYLPADPLDQSLLNTAPWPVTRVECPQRILPRARRALARAWLAAPLPSSSGHAALAHHAHAPALAAAAARISAGLYLGHCPAGLAAAAHAARRHKALLGFDLEDFHPTETGFALQDRAERRALHVLLSRLLPKCRHLTAASPAMAGECAAQFGTRPTVVLNAYPLADAPASPAIPPPISENAPAVLHWFSQTIGPGRGLEQALAVLAHLQIPALLQLQGFVDRSYEAHLRHLSHDLGCKYPPHFLPPAPPGELVRSAAPAHLGLSLELSHPPNRALCLTNKIFASLLAGLPLWLSDTPAQRDLAAQLGPAALLTPLDHPAQAATILDALLGDPPRLQQARHHAWQLARSRFCWDLEQSKFLDSVQRALAA